MKNNFVKYIFIIFAAVIMIYSFYKIHKDNQEQNQIAAEANNSEEEIIKEINLGIAELDTMNPILSNNKNVQDISKLIFEPLINITSDYNLEACLATEWAKVDDTNYVIKLRRDVEWPNREEFTGEDVRYTIDRLKEINSIYSSNVQYVTGVEVSDRYTVKITLGQAVPFFEYNLSFPIMCKSYYENEDFQNTTKNSSPIGTGMFQISSLEDGKIILSKNEKWWNKENKNSEIDTININLFSNISELYNGFKKGSIDLISTTNPNLEDYIGTIGYNSREIKGREYTFLAFNTQNAILSDTNVRKAISYSIDKDNIVSSIFNSKYYTSSFPLDYGTWIFDQTGTSLGYNVDQTKQILQDNGWGYRSNYWQKYQNYKSDKLSFNLVAKSSNFATAQNIKTQLENQGIRINIVSVDDNQYSNYLATKNYDMILCTINVSVNPDLTTYFGANNIANYSNDEVNSILQEVNNTTDSNALKEKYQRLGEIFKSEMPYIGLYSNKYVIAYNSELIGNVEGSWFDLFYNIESWHK